MVQSRVDLGESLAGLPVVGSHVRDVARDVFAGAGMPLSAFGTELERFIFVIAVVLALLLALVTLQPWLTRYVPWRLGRRRRVRAADRVIRNPSNANPADVERIRATRAVSGLEYADLLDYTPDRPLGGRAPRPTRPGGTRQHGVGP